MNKIDPELEKLWGNDQELLKKITEISWPDVPARLSLKLTQVPIERTHIKQNASDEPTPIQSFMRYWKPVLLGAVTVCTLWVISARVPGQQQASFAAEDLDSLVEAYVIEDQEPDVLSIDDLNIY